MPVYFIRCASTNATKIGRAVNVKRRLIYLQTATPHKLTLVRLLDGNVELEARLHERFAAFRGNGEWFALTDEQIAEDFGVSDLPFQHIVFSPRKPVRPQQIRTSVDVIAALGGCAQVARMMGESVSSVYHWTKPSRMISQPARWKLLRMPEVIEAGITFDILADLEPNPSRAPKWTRKRGPNAASKEQDIAA